MKRTPIYMRVIGDTAMEFRFTGMETTNNRLYAKYTTEAGSIWLVDSRWMGDEEVLHRNQSEQVIQERRNKWHADRKRKPKNK